MKTITSAQDVRWEVVFVAETEEEEAKALDDVMGILYEFGARKGLFAPTDAEAVEAEQPEISPVQIEHTVFISTPALCV